MYIGVVLLSRKLHAIRTFLLERVFFAVVVTFFISAAIPATTLHLLSQFMMNAIPECPRVYCTHFRLGSVGCR